MLREATLVAFYKTMEQAERARNRLMETGVSPDMVSISGEEKAGSTADYQPRENDGFFAPLKDLFLPDEDLYSYAAGVRHGAKMVSARLPMQLADRAIAAMEAEDPLDIETSLGEWRTAGWGDYGTQKTSEAQARRRRDTARTGRVRTYVD